MEAKVCTSSENSGTEKIYENDGYRQQFAARVISCESRGEYFEIVLDKTAFFPEGGGQNPDLGFLGDAQVFDVKERQGIIYHKTRQPLNTGTEITGQIDWQRRFDYMQQHTGEHIISGIVHRIFGYDNVGFHLGDAAVTLDFNGSLSQTDLDRVEWEANQAVFENRKVTISYPDREMLKSLAYRSKIEIDGQVRIVAVDGYDVCACCAPHVAGTGEIGMIKILGCQNYKRGVRMTIACGFRALRDYRIKQKNIGDISVLLSAKIEDAAEAVAKLHEDMQTVKYQLGAAQEELMLLQIAQLEAQAENVCLFAASMTPVIMRKAVNAMTAAHCGYCALFAGNDQQGYKFLIGSAGGDARDALNVFRTKLPCRGGGSREMVQGQISGTKDAIEAIFRSLYA